MKAPRFIARRLRFEGKMAMTSIAISFFVMIVAVAISSGFRTEIRSGISVLAGDVQITPAGMNYVSDEEPLSVEAAFMEEIKAVRGVSEVVPALYRAGIVKHGTDIHGVVFKGTESNGLDSLRVSVPSSLADLLELNVGDALLAYFVGERVKLRKFTVSQIYSSALSADENIIVYAGIRDLQRLNEWDEHEVSAIEVVLEKPYLKPKRLSAKADEIADVLYRSEDGDDVVAMSALRRFPQIFSWLDLIDGNVLLVLALMTVVAGFNMISGLLILLFRNISTIGALKSMGMTDRCISELFLRVASNLTLKGMAIGNGVAFLLCLVQGCTHFVKLNPENYFLSHVPVRLSLSSVMALDVLAYLVIMLLLLIPCLFISRVDPAKTVRAQ